MLIDGFEPIVTKTSKILILGTMPSIKSLDRHQYYGHPRNAFWHIMGDLVGAYPDKGYQQRKQLLMEHHIAVWDVLKSCIRPGSLDSDIETESIIPNELGAFLQQYNAIRHVFFNGSNAENLFKKYNKSIFDSNLSVLNFIRLPSTSPAHASLSIEEKIEIWENALSPLIDVRK